MVAPDSSDDPLIGTILDGRYKIVRTIGRGGMGRVYEGERIGIGRRVAIKLLDPLGAPQESDRARFAREATAAGKIDHPNCVGVSDFGVTAEGTPFLIMDLVVGETLYDELTRASQMPVTRAFHITRHVLRGLRHAHGLGLVHRDITPRNIILVDRDGDRDFARLLDFGLAKPTEQAAGGDQITGAGFICGTPRYMAPEQALGKPADVRTDLYSLSIVLYEMLEGAPPFSADEALKVLMKHVSDPVPAMDPAVPRQVEAMVRIGLAKNPDDRPQSADAYLAALDACAAGIENEDVGTAPTAAFTSLPPQAAPKAGASAATVKVGTRALPTPAPAPVPVRRASEPDAPAAGHGHRRWAFAVGGIAICAIAAIAYALVRRADHGAAGGGTGSTIAASSDAGGLLDPYPGSGTGGSAPIALSPDAGGGALAMTDAGGAGGSGAPVGATPWQPALDQAMAEVRARHFDSAELELDRLARTYPDVGAIQLAIGNLNAERSWPAPAIKAYRAGLARDAGLRRDPAMIAGAIKLLDAARWTEVATFLEKDLGADAIPALQRAVEEGTSSQLRQHASEVLQRLQAAPPPPP